MMNKSLGLLALLATLAAAPGAHAQSTDVVRINDFPGTGNIIARVAVAKKFCEKHGIRCETRVFASAPLAMQVLLSGELEVAYTPPEVLIQAALQGTDLKAIGSGFARSPFFLLVSNHLDLPNAAKGYPEVVKDLKGKKIGVPARGAAAEFLLKSMLKDAGLSPNDVVIVASGAPNTTYPSLQAKQIDAAVTFTPAESFCRVFNSCRIAVDTNAGEGPANFAATTAMSVTLSVKSDFAQKRPQTVAAFSAAMRDSAAFVQDPKNFDEVFAIIEQSFKIDSPKGKEIIDTSLRAMVPGVRFERSPQALQAAADYLFDTGQIKSRFDTKALWLSQ